MKKSKHFRKDVIIARIVFAVACILIGILLWVGISALMQPKGNYTNPDDEQKESQYIENSDDSESEDSQEESDAGIGSENVPEVTVVYVETIAEVRLREATNTDSTILARIPIGTQLELIEEIDGWYKVSYQGQEGYVSAEFATVIR